VARDARITGLGSEHFLLLSKVDHIACRKFFSTKFAVKPRENIEFDTVHGQQDVRVLFAEIGDRLVHRRFFVMQKMKTADDRIEILTGHMFCMIADVANAGM